MNWTDENAIKSRPTVQIQYARIFFLQLIKLKKSSLL